MTTVPLERVRPVRDPDQCTLVQLFRKPAFVVFTAGPPNARRIYQEAGELVEGFDTPPCPMILPDRTAMVMPV